MIDFFEKTKGSISLFLALIMLPMMTVAGLIVDGARISAAKASLSGAGDLAMNAALSEYDQILYDVYGIFAVSENMEELQNNVSRYFANSIDNTGILNDSDSYMEISLSHLWSRKSQRAAIRRRKRSRMRSAALRRGSPGIPLVPPAVRRQPAVSP